uniref:Uncharacterized protein n=1 Tax=Branchiostoma floridae TaxID=7739 RepID=C3Z1U5_BRAFL|eukprot:XP_002597450.1 hypothetical protein BRAFLDRAFT_80544 [Branchiostoma floridae]
MKWTRLGALSNAPGDYLIIPHLDAVVGGRQFARAAYTTTTPSESVNARNPGQGRFAGPDGGAANQHAGCPTPFLLSRAHARGDPKQTSFCLGAGVSLHMGILDSQLAV